MSLNRVWKLLLALIDGWIFHIRDRALETPREPFRLRRDSYPVERVRGFASNVESRMPIRTTGARVRPSRGLILLTAIVLPAGFLNVACGATPPALPTTVVHPTAATQPTPVAPAASQPAVLPGGDWIGFRGDASRSAVGLQGPTGNPILNWRFKAGGAVPNQIAIVGDVVYFASDEGSLHAVNRVTGAEIWKQELTSGTTTGPVVADGRIYLVDERGAVLALDPGTGGAVWESASHYDGATQLLSIGGSVYLGTGDGFLVALDAASGAEQWKVKLTPSGASVHNPAAADGFVYAGTAGAGFVAVDATTHQVVWTGDLHGDDAGTAGVNGGIAYIASGHDAPSGMLHAFDAKTGKALWVGPSPNLQTPTVSDRLAFSATRDGLVDAIDTATGTLRWSIQLTGKVRPMAVVGPTLFLAADQEQRVYAVEAATGNRLWQFDVDGSNDCCVAVAKGAVFVGTMTGSVYSIGGDGATIAAQPFASQATTATAAPTQAPFAALKVGVSWTTDIRRMGFAPFCQIAVEPKTGRIWAPEADGDRIAIFDRAGKLLEEWGSSGDGPGQFDFTRQNGDGYGTLAFAKDGSFFVLDVGNRRVQHFDAHRKLVGKWGGFGDGPGQYSDPVGIAVAADGTVWVLDDRRSVVEHYDATGKVLGSFDPFASVTSNDGANSLAIDGKGHLYISAVAPSRVLVFDAKGTMLRTVGEGRFSEQAGNMSIDASGRLFVSQGPERGSAPGVLVFGADGTPIGGFGNPGEEDSQLVFPGGTALDGRGGIYVEDSWPESNRLIRVELPAGVR
jgi:outer membrane protein assembly factor BamB